MIEWLAGLDPASPIPTPIRAPSNCQKFIANPPAAVNPLQIASAIAMIRTRLPRSASHATGMPSPA